MDDIVIECRGLEFHLDPESGWARIYDPENPGVWRDKRSLVECPLEVQQRFAEVRP